MILRMIRGRAGREVLAALRAALDTEISQAGSPAGPARWHLGARPDDPGHEVLILVVWEAAEDLAAADTERRSPLWIARRVGVEGLDFVPFEVDASVVRLSDDEPVAIRVATGRFSKPGSDIEMLELLRARAPLIGDEMCEAFVGRRLSGREVEVTFVSTWRRLPADRNLEDPLWPDIALRYDSFEVGIYTPVPRRGA